MATQAHPILAVDFTHVDTGFLRRLYVLIVRDGEVADESTRDFLKSYTAELKLAARASR